jgi:hypothetical protein
MVDVEKFCEATRRAYMSALGRNISFLAVGGSVGRGNPVDGWSDADLLLILRRADAASLRAVRASEERVSRKFGVDVDTMITTKQAIDSSDPKELHGKVKNFLYFLPQARILVGSPRTMPKMTFGDYGYGFWATYSEQQKNFLRRNADADTGDRDSLMRLFRKNIKIIFLLLKQHLAQGGAAACTYDQVLSSVEDTLPKPVVRQLTRYARLRRENLLSRMGVAELRREVGSSVDLFEKVGSIMLNRRRSRRKTSL